MRMFQGTQGRNRTNGIARLGLAQSQRYGRTQAARNISNHSALGCDERAERFDNFSECLKPAQTQHVVLGVIQRR